MGRLRLMLSTRVLRLRRDDVIVLDLPGPPTLEVVEHTREMMRETFPDHRVVVLSGGTEITIVRERKAPPVSPEERELEDPRGFEAAE